MKERPQWNKPSEQRVLIALRSFTSVAAAARSVGVSTDTLRRMALRDEEIRVAYQDCVSGVNLQRADVTRAEAKRAKEATIPKVTERTAENRMKRLFASTGRDPKLAAAALHRRLNREARETKRVALTEAVAAVDNLLAGRPTVPTKATLDAFDRWCANCKAHRVDDPCEVCNRKTLEVK